MKILLLETYPEIKREYLDYLEKDNEFFEIWDEYSDTDINVIIVRSKIKVDSKLLDKYKKLKFVARVWVGLDKIDLKECEKRWVKVLNTPWANSDSVADLVLAWILNLNRKLYFDFEWIEKRYDYMWFELSSRKVSIVWFWNIGKKIYSRLKSFWVKKFLIYDPFISKEKIEENQFCTKIEDKNIIFKESNIISFHLPLLDETRNFLWQEEIKLLKKDVIIVNTSRWWIINENKLIDFLQKNPESWAFLDVWEEEPEFPKPELLNLENCIVTPHIGAMTKEAEEKMHFFKELI